MAHNSRNTLGVVSSARDGRDQLLRYEDWSSYREMECWRMGDWCSHRISITKSLGALPLEENSGVRTSGQSYFPNTKATHRTGLEIVATSVTLEQENLTSPVTLSFSTIQRTPMEQVTSLYPMVLIWCDYLIVSYSWVRSKRIYGLLLWSLRENVTSYIKVCNSFFWSLDALNSDSPIDDILSVSHQNL